MHKETDYAAIGAEIGKLVKRKQEAYGDSFGKSGEVLGILYPKGVKPGQYRNLLATARVIDKLFRIANQEGAFNEDPWQDIAGYAVLAVARNRKRCEGGISRFDFVPKKEGTFMANVQLGEDPEIVIFQPNGPGSKKSLGKLSKKTTPLTRNKSAR